MWSHFCCVTFENVTFGMIGGLLDQEGWLERQHMNHIHTTGTSMMGNHIKYRIEGCVMKATLLLVFEYDYTVVCALF
jgi:hypothetical protein